jgi:hypothetical protein
MACLKINTLFDLKSFSFKEINLLANNKPDISYAENILKNISQKDLIIRDLGYFVLEVFNKIKDIGAYFLSRHKTNVNIYTKNGKEIILWRTLKNYKENIFQANVFLGQNQALACRLIAFRLSATEVNKRRRKLKQLESKKQKIYTKKHRQLLGWSIYITNTTEEILPLNTIYEIYRLRWQIELIFKTWKSYFGIDYINAKSSINTLQTLIYAKLIMIIIVYYFYSEAVFLKNEQLSYMKFIKLLKTDSLNWLNKIFTNKKSLLRYFEQSFEYILKYSVYEKRKRKSTFDIVFSMQLG